MTAAARLLNRLRGSQNVGSLRKEVSRRYLDHYERLRAIPTGGLSVDKHYKKGQALLDREAAASAAAGGTAGVGGVAVASDFENNDPLTEKEKKAWQTLVEKNPTASIQTGSAGGMQAVDYWNQIEQGNAPIERPALARQYFYNAQQSVKAKKQDDINARNQTRDGQQSVNIPTGKAAESPENVAQAQEGIDTKRKNVLGKYKKIFTEDTLPATQKEFDKLVAEDIGYDSIKKALDDEAITKEELNTHRNDWAAITKFKSEKKIVESAEGKGNILVGRSKREIEAEEAGPDAKNQTNKEKRTGGPKTKEFTPPIYTSGRHKGRKAKVGSKFYNEGDDTQPGFYKWDQDQQSAKFVKEDPEITEEKKTAKKFANILTGPDKKGEGNKLSQRQVDSAVGYLNSPDNKNPIDVNKLHPKGHPKAGQYVYNNRDSRIMGAHKHLQKVKKDQAERIAAIAAAKEAAEQNNFSSKIRLIAFEKGKKDRKAIYAGAAVGGVGGTEWARRRHRDMVIRDRILKKRGMTPRSRAMLNTNLYGGGALRVLGGAGLGALAGLGIREAMKKRKKK